MRKLVCLFVLGATLIGCASDDAGEPTEAEKTKAMNNPYADQMQTGQAAGQSGAGGATPGGTGMKREFKP